LIGFDFRCEKNIVSSYEDIPGYQNACDVRNRAADLVEAAVQTLEVAQPLEELERKDDRAYTVPTETLRAVPTPIRRTIPC